MFTRRALLTTLPMALCLPAQATTGKPTSASQTEILHLAAARALAYTRELPDFICTETVRRSDNVRGLGWKLKDVLGLQVGISERREYYKLLTYNGRPTELSYRQVGGALTEGEFGSLLAEIFRPGIATFHWSKTLQLAGRTIQVFQYRVRREKATYHLEYGYRSGQPVSTTVGHKGLIWIDEETARVTRVEQAAEIPRSFPLKVSKTILEFSWVEIAGQRWLLPRHASSTMGNSEILTNNEVEFSNYRKFSADSSVTFVAPEREQP